jgi:N-acetylmuramoyl-L-alanine amidase
MTMGPITHLTIHCAATPEGRHVDAATISAWDKAKFGQVSYHAVCELDGKIVYTLKDDQKGAHVGGHNTGNLGLCYVGGVDAKGNPKDTRTPAQKAAMAEYIRQKQKLYPAIKILGHRDWPDVHKACPSFSVADWLKAGMPV